jgi:GntR family transcriptional regulator/MocR family aminotransferase
MPRAVAPAGGSTQIRLDQYTVNQLEASLQAAKATGSPTPLHRQLYEGIRSTILSGQLPPGTQLPATRALAADLGLSRTTVMAAFDQLLAEGYIEGRHGSGTYISSLLPEQLLHAEAAKKATPGRASAPPRLSNRGQVLASTFSAFAQIGHRPRAFELGSPALDEFQIRLPHCTPGR